MTVATCGVSPHPRAPTVEYFHVRKQLRTLQTQLPHLDRVQTYNQTRRTLLPQIHPPRSGMSSELGLYTRTGGKTHTCSACSTCDLKDYTGSYHVSISLPHDPEGWILYDEAALSVDGGACSETYVRDCAHDGEMPLSVWVDAHMVSDLVWRLRSSEVGVTRRGPSQRVGGRARGECFGLAFT